MIELSPLPDASRPSASTARHKTALVCSSSMDNRCRPGFQTNGSVVTARRESVAVEHGQALDIARVPLCGPLCR